MTDVGPNAFSRADLVNAVVSRTGLSRREADAAVTAITDSITAEIKAGNRVTVFGFGSFEPRQRAARLGRNPQTGQSMEMPARRTVAFRPASAFKSALAAKRRVPAKKAVPAKGRVRKSTFGKTSGGAVREPKKATVSKRAAPVRRARKTKKL
jgi:DNA-binding protein HU-beta